MADTLRGPDGEGVWDVDAEATLFGFEGTPAHVRVQPRGRVWRIGGAARAMAIFVVIAPLVAIVPPHAVWFIGSLSVGGFLARKRYVERFTLRALQGVCPKCGSELEAKPGRLHAPHPVPCATCNHEPTVRLPDGALERMAKE